MKVKILEIRDSATFIPILAVDMNSDNNIQRYYLRHEGYPCDYEPNILITHLSANGGPSSNDPYTWNGRTYPVAHKYIIDHWHDLIDGDVIDVEWILNEKADKKISERLESTSYTDLVPF